MNPLPQRGLLAFAAAMLVLASTPAAHARTSAVPIRDNYFSIPFLVLTVGDTIRWENQGAARHTVRSYEGAPASFDSSPGTSGGNCAPLLGSADCLEPGASFRVTFSEPGTIEYYCKVQGHADPSVSPDPDIASGREQPCGMCGVIVVKAKASPKPLVRRSPSPSPEPSEPSPSPTGTESAEPAVIPVDPGATPSMDPSPAAAGGVGRLAVGFGAIIALGGAGFWIWQRFLAPR